MTDWKDILAQAETTLTTIRAHMDKHQPTKKKLRDALDSAYNEVMTEFSAMNPPEKKKK